MKDLIPEEFTLKRPLAIIIRHAQRDPFILGSKEEPLLTRKGRDDAFRFGQELKTFIKIGNRRRSLVFR